jgi:hydrogenase-4 membrane subunit HyfE
MFPIMNSLVDLILVITILLVGVILPAPVPVQILLYRVLSGILAILTLWTALVGGNVWGVILIAIPIGFAIFIGWIASKIVGSNKIVKLTRKQWITCCLIGLVLIALTIAVTPLLLAHGEWGRTLQLVTALAFVLVGICIWLVRKHLISQAIGLLVMDDGLFLLSASVLQRMDLTSILLLVLFLYLLVPLICLLRVMPRLGQKTLDADQFRELRG